MKFNCLSFRWHFFGTLLWDIFWDTFLRPYFVTFSVSNLILPCRQAPLYFGNFLALFLALFWDTFGTFIGCQKPDLAMWWGPTHPETVEPFVWIGFLGNDNPNHSLLSIHSLSANTEIECDMFSQLLPKNGSLGKNPNQIWHIGNKNLEINKSGL